MINRYEHRIPLGILFIFLMFCCCAYAWASPEDEDGTSGVRVSGVLYNLAEDRQFNKIGGVNQPEGLDIYLKRHFDQMTSEIKALQSQIDSMQKDLREIRELLQPAGTQNQ